MVSSRYHHKLHKHERQSPFPAVLKQRGSKPKKREDVDKKKMSHNKTGSVLILTKYVHFKALDIEKSAF